ncbi:hypothetical protein PVAP13_5KG130500 [Panicum virgatum]|uniref:Uncharacterized protein n=1 Tax=Panicum virgatum TaxID=38727 RepID=A0A8T0SGH9_PANVG|nr:hypothetical protein PVAP13_5KG130500 [Panicum virgatum]
MGTPRSRKMQQARAMEWSGSHQNVPEILPPPPHPVPSPVGGPAQASVQAAFPPAVPVASPFASAQFIAPRATGGGALPAPPRATGADPCQRQGPRQRRACNHQCRRRRIGPRRRRNPGRRFCTQ